MSQTPDDIKIGVLIGGGGRLPALVRWAQQNGSGVEIGPILSYKKISPGLDWAIAQGLDARPWRWADWKARDASRQEYDAALAELLAGQGVELIVLAGWGLLLSPAFLARFAGRIINVHPALLTDTPDPTTTLSDGRTIPVFRGNDAIGLALAAQVDTTGCTVHYVTDEMDVGPVLLRREVPVLPDDTPETLAERIHAAEDALLPLGLALAVARLRAEREA